MTIPEGDAETIQSTTFALVAEYKIVAFTRRVNWI